MSIERGFSLLKAVARNAGLLVRQNRKRFYVGLAGMFMVGMLANTYIHTFTSSIKSRALDFTLRQRISSPQPDPKIIILDIDERSLAELAPAQGRWPWQRSVLAESIAAVSEAGAKSIFLNVMMSDPDKSNPYADRIFQYVAAHASNVAYPLVRLGEEGDASSEVSVSMVQGAERLDEEADDFLISLLYPYFPATHDTLGMVNLSADRDGILRNYAVYHVENDWRLPSAALRALQLAGEAPDVSEDEADILLNWRNKRGDYRRISFADVHAATAGKRTLDWSVFKGAIVIIGASAPSISTIKPTSSSPTTLDNVIIATAIDDLKNDTYLHQMPRWLGLLIAAAVIVMLVYCFLTGIPETYINLFFVIGQILLLVFALLQVSFTNYYLDFTDALLFGMAYFAIAKIYSMLDRNATRGAELFAAMPRGEMDLLLIGIHSSRFYKWPLVCARNKFEQIFGFQKVYFIDTLFGDDHIFAEASGKISFYVLLVPRGSVSKTATGSYEIQTAIQAIPLTAVSGRLQVQETRLIPLQADLAGDEAGLRKVIGVELADIALFMLTRQPADDPEPLES